MKRPHEVAADVASYLSLAELVGHAEESGCECDVCADLRAANVTAGALGNRVRFARLTWASAAIFGLLVINTVLTFLLLLDIT